MSLKLLHVFRCFNADTNKQKDGFYIKPLSDSELQLKCLANCGMEKCLSGIFRILNQDFKILDSGIPIPVCTEFYRKNDLVQERSKKLPIPVNRLLEFLF